MILKIYISYGQCPEGMMKRGESNQHQQMDSENVNTRDRKKSI